jgi:hypothetical protein
LNTETEAQQTDSSHLVIPFSRLLYKPLPKFAGFCSNRSAAISMHQVYPATGNNSN